MPRGGHQIDTNCQKQKKMASSRLIICMLHPYRAQKHFASAALTALASADHTRSHYLPTSFHLTRSTRAEISNAFEKVIAHSQGVGISDTDTLRDLYTHARLLRTAISDQLGNFSRLKTDLANHKKIDLSTVCNPLGHLWDQDVARWSRQTTEAYKNANKKLQDLAETMAAKQPKSVILYHQDGRPFEVEVEAISNEHGMLGTFVRLSSKVWGSESYTVSLEQFMRMQKKPVLLGPASADPMNIVSFIESAFAETSLTLSKVECKNTHYYIECRTSEGRRYKIKCDVQTSNSTVSRYELRIKDIIDYQNIVTAKDYSCFMNERLTRGCINLIHGKSNLMNTTAHFPPRTAPLSRLERMIAKAKSWLY